MNQSTIFIKHLCHIKHAARCYGATEKKESTVPFLRKIGIFLPGKLSTYFMESNGLDTGGLRGKRQSSSRLCVPSSHAACGFDDRVRASGLVDLATAGLNRANPRSWV